MPSTSKKFLISRWGLLLLLVLPFVAEYAESAGSIVRTLPGYSGVLPFKLETGYVSVNESQLFYLFVESQGNPQRDPLLVYLVGGPGCSALNAFFFQTGPLIFNTEDYFGGLPQLLYNPNSWTKTASMIFVDSPVGTGYSYATSPEGYYTSDTKSATEVQIFLRKWLTDHPEFINLQFFIASDSYVGIITPLIAQEILEGNEAGLRPTINLKGFVSGSPHTDYVLEKNSVIPLAFRLALISQSLYESAKKNCKGRYFDADPSNAPCLEVLEKIDQCLEPLNEENVLDPKCNILSPKENDEQVRRSLRANSRHFHPPLNTRKYWCRNFDYLLAKVWANDERVKNALHVRNGTVKEWYRCNITLQNDAYTSDVTTAVVYYQNLTSTGLQVLLYSGDHDTVVSYLSTEEWISSLNLTVDTAWRPWFVDGQVSGYTTTYKDQEFGLTFATLKGAGHSPTQYMPVDCYNMFDRWIHYFPL